MKHTYESILPVTNLNAVRVRKAEAAWSYSGFGKRMFDIVFGLAVAPIVLPVIGLLWVLARLDGGPGFYRQVRVGRGGKRFLCFKLRTMVVNAEAVLADLCARDDKVAAAWLRDQKLQNDPRITRLGHFLRRSSLDELPQYLNVMAGQMSFIGPRPFTTDQEDIYRKAGGRAYFTLRPGISGIWQVKGRGQTGFVDRVQYDERYSQTIGLLTDLQLILLTVGAVLRMTGR